MIENKTVQGNEKERIEFKNWGPFHEYLMNKHSTYNSNRKAELDPYKQLSLDRKIQQVKEIEQLYRTYLKNIDIKNFDKGVIFLQQLEQRVFDLTKTLDVTPIGHMKDVHNDVFRSLVEIFKEFKRFRTED